MHADELAIGNQQTHRLDFIHLHADLRFVGADAGELAVGRAGFRVDEVVADVHREDEGVVDVFPVRAAENEGLAVLPHEIMDRLPVPAHLRRRPPMTMELHVLDAADVRAGVHEDAAAQHAPIHAADAVPDVASGPMRMPL